MTSTLRLFVLLIALAGTGSAAVRDVWTVVAFDPKGDAPGAHPADAAQLSYRYDRAADTLWFRVTLYGQATDSIGITLAVDTGTPGAQKTNWTGANRRFTFDRLLKLRPTRVEGDSVVVGVSRKDLSDATTLRVVAALEHGGAPGDDMPNVMSASIDLSGTRATRGMTEIDTSRNNLRFSTRRTTLADGAMASFVKSGRGRDTLILIPGVYSGRQAFDGFLARNSSRYRTYVVTPPGLNGTTPRALPPESESYGLFHWTRALEKDILRLIENERLSNPILVAHGFPGSIAVRSIAAAHPTRVGGVVEISTIAVQASPSFREPGKPAAPEERIAVVDDGWVSKWFKYVTPETWENNNYPAAMLSNDPRRAESARAALEAAPLEVKIRYLAEFMASDQTSQLATLDVPMLVLRPGFDEKTLADPAHGFFKTFFLDSWTAVAPNPRIQVLTIPNARALLLDDQPKAADEAIAAFVTSRKK